jgi:hypothetical protein
VEQVWSKETGLFERGRGRAGVESLGCLGEEQEGWISETGRLERGTGSLE